MPGDRSRLGQASVWRATVFQPEGEAANKRFTSNAKCFSLRRNAASKGPLLATLAEIAKRAGVSPAVVSRVINKDATLRIAKETRARVEAVVREMDYAPNVAAQSLRSARSGTVAVVLHDIANPVYGEILRGAQEEAERRDKAILLGDAAVGGASGSRLARMIGGGGVDGLILQASGTRTDALIVQAARQEVPVVLLQARLEGDAHLILLPDAQAAAVATAHLRQLGHRRIGCLATEPGLTFTEDRMRGWRQEMGGDADEACVTHSGPTAAEGEAAARDLLSRHPDLTGLVCFNAVAAVGALRAARALGRNVPEDLSVIAIHDLKFAGDLRVPLTVVRMPLAEMGRASIRTICDPSHARATTHRITTRPELVIRASAAAPPRPG